MESRKRLASENAKCKLGAGSTLSLLHIMTVVPCPSEFCGMEPHLVAISMVNAPVTVGRMGKVISLIQIDRDRSRTSGATAFGLLS